MMRNRHGVIVNISAVAGPHALPRRNAYTASKHGVIGLTKALACAWAQDGIRGNAIAPGYVRTPFAEGLIAQGKDRKSRRLNYRPSCAPRMPSYARNNKPQNP